MSHLLSGLAPRIVMSITIGKVPDPWKFTPEVEEITPDYGEDAFRGETRGATRRDGDRTRRDGERRRDSLGRRRIIISVKHLPG